MPTATTPSLRIAIIGGGPGGLGTAIALSALQSPQIEVTIYEQARELREVGAGINIGYNCWKVLELLGAAEGVRGHRIVRVLHRNGISGDILKESGAKMDGTRYQSQRVRRTRLQSALKEQVPAGIIKLQKKLVKLERLDGDDDGNGGRGTRAVRLEFADGEVVEADLVVGGDGIRSVVREHVFPDPTIRFTGTTIFRALLPVVRVRQLRDIGGEDTAWWHGPAGHFYGTIVDDPGEVPEEEMRYEIAARSVIDPATAVGKRFSWGVPCTKERVESFFKEYHPSIREALSQVDEAQWKEFSAFAGPRLEKLIAWESRVVLIGDASHPLSGAFGSGAAFALEDGWILARAIEFTGGNLPDALELFDSIRSPYYRRMYEHLDQQKEKLQAAKARHPKGGLDEALRARVASFGEEGKMAWIYENNIEEVWDRESHRDTNL